MENQKTVTKKNTKKDALNISNVKIDIKKGKKDLISKEASFLSGKSLYKGMDALSTDEKKKARGKIRRQLKSFINQILGKDRSEEERETSIESFMTFYQDNWMIQDLKIESFTNTRNDMDRKDCIDLLDYLKSVTG